MVDAEGEADVEAVTEGEAVVLGEVVVVVDGVALTDAVDVAEGVALVKRAAPSFAVVDLRLGDGNGLDVIEALHQARPEARAVVLTGYGNIATAVSAMKTGAID